MIFLDANIFLETIVPGRSNPLAVGQYLDKVSETTAMSLLTVHLIMHFGRQYAVSDTILHTIISQNELIPQTPADYEWSTLYEQGRDFEDALQIACAVRSGCSEFVTLDKKLAKAYAGGPIKITLLA